MNASTFTLALLAGFVALAAAAPSDAGTNQTPAAAACKSALPVFDGNIRSRPRGVQNEGTAAAYVSCGQQSDFDVVPTITHVVLLNTGAAEVEVSCTLVVGASTPVYYTKTATVPANSYGSALTYVPGKGEDWSSRVMAYSCNLPPGAGVSRVSFS